MAADTLGGAYRKLHHQLLQDNQLHQLSQAKEIQASFFTLCKFLGWFYTEINKLDWSLLIDELYKKGVCHLFLLRKLRSLDICSRLLQSIFPLKTGPHVYPRAIASIPPSNHDCYTCDTSHCAHGHMVTTDCCIGCMDLNKTS